MYFLLIHVDGLFDQFLIAGNVTFDEQSFIRIVHDFPHHEFSSGFELFEVEDSWVVKFVFDDGWALGLVTLGLILSFLTTHVDQHFTSRLPIFEYTKEVGKSVLLFEHLLISFCLRPCLLHNI